MSESDDINELRAGIYFLAMMIAILCIFTDHSCGKIKQIEQRIEAVERRGK